VFQDGTYEMSHALKIGLSLPAYKRRARQLAVKFLSKYSRQMKWLWYDVAEFLKEVLCRK